jgi:hypothetical protein
MTASNTNSERGKLERLIQTPATYSRDVKERARQTAQRDVHRALARKQAERRNSR